MSFYSDAHRILVPSGWGLGKIYLQKVMPVFYDFNRDSVAYRTNEFGVLEEMAIDYPRIDYQAAGCPELLIEQERENLVIRSKEFDNASWAKANLTVSANTHVAPDGTTTADTLTEAAVNSSFHADSATMTVVSTEVYTMSVYVKSNGRRYVLLYEGFSDIGTYFDLQTGVALGNQGAGTFVSANIKEANEDFYLISVTYVQSGTSASLQMYLSNNGTGVAYNGNGTSGIIVWGAQNELGTYATTRINTISAALTRDADFVSDSALDIADIGTHYVWFRNIEDQVNESVLVSAYIGVDDYVVLKVVGSNTVLEFYDSTVPATETFTYPNTIGDGETTNKIAFSYDVTSGEVHIAINGAGFSEMLSSVVNAPYDEIGLGGRNGQVLINQSYIKAYLFFLDNKDEAYLENLTQ